MNEVVPSGVLLQRLIQNSHTDILNREKNNDRFMHLYHIGTYWVAFERSACRLCAVCFRKVNFLCFVFQVVRSMW